MVSEYHHGQGCSFHTLKEEQRLFFKPSFPISLKISMSTQETLNIYFLFSCHWYVPFLKHARVYLKASSRANISLDSFLYWTNFLPPFCVISMVLTIDQGARHGWSFYFNGLSSLLKYSWGLAATLVFLFWFFSVFSRN